jgi:hypothetical protein
LAKGGLIGFVERFVQGSTLVLRMNFGANKIPPFANPQTVMCHFVTAHYSNNSNKKCHICI